MDVGPEGKGMSRVFGHRNALTAVRESIESAAQIGVKAITLYAFSTENWNRPKLEVDALMSLLVNSLKKELLTFQRKWSYRKCYWKYRKLT